VVLSGIVEYRIYRTPVDGTPGGDEVLLDVVDASTTSFIDDGTLTLGSAAPLPQGSTSAWQSLPDLAVAREGGAVAAAVDPLDAGTWYVYALQGRSGTTGHTSYEYLPVAIEANGRQTAAAAWITGAEASVQARWNHGVWRVDDRVSSKAAGETYLFVGAGAASGGFNGKTEATTVSAGGELTAFVDTPDDMSQVRGAYGAAAAGAGSGANEIVKLLAFGGDSTGGIRENATGARLDILPDITNWNNDAQLLGPRAYMGTAVQSAHIFLIGGSSTGTNALSSTETVVW
jgi:hypothetical protein